MGDVTETVQEVAEMEGKTKETGHAKIKKQTTQKSNHGPHKNTKPNHKAHKHTKKQTQSTQKSNHGSCNL